MLKNVIQFSTARFSCLKCAVSQLAQPRDFTKSETGELVTSTEIEEKIAPSTERSVLEPLSEDISHVTTYLKPTFNFAAYVNKSETLQKLVEMGVDLSHIETKVNDALPFILKLKFSEIEGHIMFLNDLGVDLGTISKIISKNPFLLKESLEDLNVRINYLRCKQFDGEMIVRILSHNPFWLSYSTQDIDKKLGFFQKNFKLKGHEVRQLATQYPKLITHKESKIKTNMFVIKEEMGFIDHEMKTLLLAKPKLFMTVQHKLLKTFDYLHNVMKISHEMLLKTPEILTYRENKLKERHQFLVKLKRDQYDPKLPNYVGLLQMMTGTDAEFATEVAKSSTETYNLFLKTL